MSPPIGRFQKTFVERQSWMVPIFSFWRVSHVNVEGLSIIVTSGRGWTMRLSSPAMLLFYMYTHEISTCMNVYIILSRCYNSLVLSIF